jgi:hypothetical protein
MCFSLITVQNLGVQTLAETLAHATSTADQQKNKRRSSSADSTTGSLPSLLSLGNLKARSSKPYSRKKKRSPYTVCLKYVQLALSSFASENGNCFTSSGSSSNSDLWQYKLTIRLSSRRRLGNGS